MNHLQNFFRLNNRYFALRHGQSEANTQGIIISDPETGIGGYGLTERGEREVRSSVMAAVRGSIRGCLSGNCTIFSSDFKRTSETAAIAQELLRAKRLEYAPALRERFFGSFEGKDATNYQVVWGHDAKWPHQPDPDRRIESTDAVLDRVTGLVYDLERTFAREHILFVSHGDPIHILQTAFDNVPLAQHSVNKPFETAELRELRFNRHDH
jgi:broad specificity phosphatase PhoE